MFVFFHRPFAHGLVARQRCNFSFVKDKSRRAMSQPANVNKGFAQEAFRGDYEATMVPAADGADGRKHEASGRLRLEIRKPVFAHQISNEKADRGWAGSSSSSRGCADFGLDWG